MLSSDNIGNNHMCLFFGILLLGTKLKQILRKVFFLSVTREPFTLFMLSLV